MAVRAKNDIRESIYPAMSDNTASIEIRGTYFFIKGKIMVKNTLFTIRNKRHKTITLPTLKITNGFVVQWIVREFPKLQIQVRFLAKPPWKANETVCFFLWGAQQKSGNISSSPLQTKGKATFVLCVLRKIILLLDLIF